MLLDPDSGLKLSREFDGLVSSNARPSDIFDFLDEAGGLQAVFRESLLVRRLFESDFFFRCSGAELGRLVSVFGSVPSWVPYPAFLAWQLAESGSPAASAVRYECRKKLADIRSAAAVRNPRDYAYGRLVRYEDGILGKLCIANAFLTAPERLGHERMADLFDHLGYSLFQGRILQPDFFSVLDDRLKARLVSGMESSMSPRFCMKFVKSVISGDFELKFKLAVIRILRDRIADTGFTICGKRIKDLLGGYGSFSEFMLCETSNGTGADPVFSSSAFVLYMLVEKPDWLLEWVGFDQKGVDKWLKCSDIVQEVADDRCSAV